MAAAAMAASSPRPAQRQPCWTGTPEVYFTKHIEERPIAPVVRETKDMLEISHRLMVMNAEQERNGFHTLHIVASKVWSGTARTSG